MSLQQRFRSALLVVDAQNVYTDPESELYCKDAKATITKINKLIVAFKGTGQTIVFIRHIHKKDGSDLGRMFDFTGEPEDDFNFKEGSDEIDFDSNLAKPKEYLEVKKNRYSAFVGTDLHRKLQQLNIQEVIICGFMTNFCCESTARDAHDLDYFVTFVSDATGTPGTATLNQSKIRKVVSELLESGFAVVISTNAFLKGRNKSKG